MEIENDFTVARCEKCGTYSFYNLFEDMSECKSCNNSVDTNSNEDIKIDE